MRMDRSAGVTRAGHGEWKEPSQNEGPDVKWYMIIMRFRQNCQALTTGAPGADHEPWRGRIRANRDEVIFAPSAAGGQIRPRAWTSCQAPSRPVAAARQLFRASPGHKDRPKSGTKWQLEDSCPALGSQTGALAGRHALHGQGNWLGNRGVAAGRKRDCPIRGEIKEDRLHEDQQPKREEGQEKMALFGTGSGVPVAEIKALLQFRILVEADSATFRRSVPVVSGNVITEVQRRKGFQTRYQKWIDEARVGQVR
jgi:hypothetical protein